MYTCELCQKTVPPQTKAHRLTVEQRPRHYPKRLNANRVQQDRKIYYTDDSGGNGYEIAREVVACPECAANYRRSDLKP